MAAGLVLNPNPGGGVGVKRVDVAPAPGHVVAVPEAEPVRIHGVARERKALLLAEVFDDSDIAAIVGHGHAGAAVGHVEVRLHAQHERGLGGHAGDEPVVLFVEHQVGLADVVGKAGFVVLEERGVSPLHEVGGRRVGAGPGEHVGVLQGGGHPGVYEVACVGEGGKEQQ